MGWEEAFEHKLLSESKHIKPSIKDLFRGEDKENYSSNIAQYRPKYEEMTYLTNISSKLKKDLS